MDCAQSRHAVVPFVLAAVLLALTSAAATAQNAPGAERAAEGDESSGELSTAVVSSTRLQNAGFDAPTPTQVLNSEALAAVAQPNIFDAVIQLPALQGSTGTTYETGSTSTGLQGLSTLSLRGFSPLRTLTLFDGQRVVGSNINQTVDVSLLPQMLVQRVDVVTGGASASWGSDAIAGVVNFVTDKKFNGFKSDISYGTSAYGDNNTTTAKLAAGTPFAGDRGHFEVAGEYSRNTGVENTGNPLDYSGCSKMVGGRPWDGCSNTIGWGSAAATPAGQPNYYWGPVVLGVTSLPNGLITAGPLTGQAFGPNGQLYPFQYAGGGVPAPATLALKSGNGAIVGTNGGVCVGTNGCLATPGQPGDQSGTLTSATLSSPITRDTTFARLSFDITPTTEIFTTFNYGHSITLTEPGSGVALSTSSIPCNYAFFTAAIQQECNLYYGGGTLSPGTALPAGAVNNSNATYPVGFFPVGTGPTDGAYQQVHIERQQRRFVLGGDGSFDLFSRNWTWDTYAEYGANTSNLNIYNMQLKPAYTAGFDAIIPAGGTSAVCALSSQNSIGPVGANGQLTTAAGNAKTVLPGCVPINFFAGPGGNTSAANSYVLNRGIGPYDTQNQVQEAGGLNINVKPVKLWAGDLSTAFGVDYRLENYHAYADPYGNGTNLQANGVTPILATQGTDPFTAAYPYYSALTPTQIAVGSTGWSAGNYHIGSGQYTVEEAFLETGIPLYKIPGWGSLDADLAGRFEHYNTNGSYYTWKIGFVWETPLPGVRVRALQSADLRAPNLSEAFAPVTTINNTSVNPFNGQQFNAAIANVGNTALLPETSKTQQVGVVFQPEFVPGLQASLDYYRIALVNVIGTTSTFQQELTNCFDGLEAYCSQKYITTSNGVNVDAAAPGGARGSGCVQPICNVTTIQVPLGNLASATTQGIDLEMSYQFKLNQWGIPGAFGVHGIANHVYGFISCPNQPATVCTDYSGALGYFSTSTSYSAAGGTIPTWKTVTTEQYGDDWGSLFLSQRWFNAGTFGNNFLVCNPGTCPTRTAAQYSEYPTVNYNHMPGAIYWDAGATLNFFNSKIEVYAKVNNIANLAPPPSGSFPGTQSGGLNNTLYDIIGRMYYGGFRIHL